MRLRLAFVALVVGTSFLALLGCAACDQSFATENLPQGTFDNVGTAAAPLRLWVEERGRGEPILMLHGFGATMYTWRYVAPALAHMHRVVTVDLKGSGRSDKPFDDRYRVLDQVALPNRGQCSSQSAQHLAGGEGRCALARMARSG